MSPQHTDPQIDDQPKAANDASPGAAQPKYQTVDLTIDDTPGGGTDPYNSTGRHWLDLLKAQLDD